MTSYNTLFNVLTVNTFLVPQMDLAMRVIPHSSAFMDLLKGWRDKLQDTILRTQRVWLSHPNREAFCEVTGLVDLPRYCRYTRAAIVVQRLNTRDNFLPLTAWARLAATSSEGSRSSALAAVNARSKPSGRKLSTHWSAMGWASSDMTTTSATLTHRRCRWQKSQRAATRLNTLDRISGDLNFHQTGSLTLSGKGWCFTCTRMARQPLVSMVRLATLLLWSVRITRTQ